jgi:thiol-disulfide isomerase/thioredoxin
LRRLVLVAVLVLVITAAYRLPEAPEQTGTGTLTVSQPWPTPGEEVPSFEATQLNGERFVMPGEGTYVVSFWSRLNQSSQSARPEFERLAHEYEDSEASFAAIYVGGILEEDRDGSPYAVIQDNAGELTSLYNVKRVPRIFLIKNGTIQLAENSFSEETQQNIRRELDSALRDGG